MIAPEDRWLLDMGLTPADIKLTRAFEQAERAERIVRTWHARRRTPDTKRGRSK